VSLPITMRFVRGAAPEVEPWLDLDFSTYADTTALKADNTVFFSSSGANPSLVSLETDGGFGSSGKRMRFNYEAAPCDSDYGISRMVRMPPDEIETWCEVTARFDTGFDAALSGNTGCTYTYGMKFLFLVRDPGRFEVVLLGKDYAGEVGTGGFGQTAQPNFFVDPSFMLDGEWHTWRWNVKYGASGKNRIWLDGVLAHSYEGVTSDPATPAMPFLWLQLAANINNGFSVPTWVDWGRIRIYNTDPGWGV